MFALTGLSFPMLFMKTINESYGTVAYHFSWHFMLVKLWENSSPRNKKVVKLCNVLPELVLPAPLPVDSRLHSPQIDMSLKGSTQLSASPGVIVDPALHKLTPVCSFHLNMTQKALWMIHIQKVQSHAIFSGLEALDDSISQPTPFCCYCVFSAVQGLDEFHPEAIVQPNDTKFNEGLSLDTEVMQSVSSLVSTEIHSPRREQSKEIPSNASRGAFSISTLNSAPVELYPQLLTSQGMINPIFVLHAERFSGNDGVLQRDQQSSREAVEMQKLCAGSTTFPLIMAFKVHLFWVATVSASLDSDISVGLESALTFFFSVLLLLGLEESTHSVVQGINKDLIMKDPRKLTMKDLIMLAEFRERQSSKEAAAAKKPFRTSSPVNGIGKWSYPV
ncbi:hypothetical protein ACLOJK_038467 [Asimina triloba]